MYNYTNLLVYNKDETSLGERVDLLLKSLPFSFITFETIEDILTQSQDKRCSNLIVVHNPDIYNKLNSIDLPSTAYDNFIIVYHDNQLPISKFAKYYTEKNLDNLYSLLALLNPVSIPDFAQKMVRIELEKLNLSKKYLAFKYIVDIICHSLYTNTNDPFSTNTLSYIAKINNTSWNSVERDVRHMLVSNWNANEIFKSAIYKYITRTDINTKILLTALIDYIKEYK